MQNKRKVCVVVASRANYGRVKYLMKAIKENGLLELQLIVGASTLLDRFGRAVDVIQGDGFKPDRSIHYVVEGETLLTQAKSTGLGIIELATAFEDLKPDVVVTVADRFETMATAIASSYMNIPLVHVQGGEISGNIDDRVRHAITKLADYHFVSSKDAEERVIKLGEHGARVFNFGCPAMDILINTDLSISNKIMSNYAGVGDEINWRKPYILMVQHPVTTSYGDGQAQVNSILNAIREVEDVQKIVLWPNIDAGSDDVSKGIRVYRESHHAKGFRFFKNFSPEDYARILKNAVCCVGNSSSFIREGSFLGVPTVIVGDRQRDREHSKNVIFVDYNESEIKSAVLNQIKHGCYERDILFGDGRAGKRMADEICVIDLKEQKRNRY